MSNRENLMLPPVKNEKDQEPKHGWTEQEKERESMCESRSSSLLPSVWCRTTFTLLIWWAARYLLQLDLLLPGKPLQPPPPPRPRWQTRETWEHENVAATSGQDDQWTSWANQTGHSLKLHSQIKHWFQSRSAGKTSQNRSFYLNTKHSKATTRL